MLKYFNMLDTTSINIIQDFQSKAIAKKSLVQEQLDLIFKNSWFNIWVPKEYGGLEYNLPQGLNLLEELAYYDGGLGWTVTLCSGANMFAGFIEPKKAKEVFQVSSVCFGGSGKCNGKAVWDGSSYSITGKWSFATGSPHLSHFTLNAPVYDHDTPRLDASGLPVVLSFFVPREFVLIHYDWDTFGLECTASHSFSMDNVRVDFSHAFVLSPEKRFHISALYKIPFMSFAELTLLVNYIGMYRRFLDLTEKYFFEKSKDLAWAEKYSKIRFRKIDALRQQLDKDREFVKEAVEKLWKYAEDETLLQDDDYLLDISHKSQLIVESIRVNSAYIMPWLGIQAAQLDNEINIVFRNLFTATQHSLLNGRN